MVKTATSSGGNAAEFLDANSILESAPQYRLGRWFSCLSHFHFCSVDFVKSPQFPISGYPAWIRTKNNACKGRCVTVRPRGSRLLDLRLEIANRSAAIKPVYG